MIDIPAGQRVLHITEAQELRFRFASFRIWVARNATILLITLALSVPVVYWAAAYFRVRTAVAYFGAGLRLYHQKCYDEAIRQYQQAIRILPYYSGSYDNWGLCLEAQGQLDQALAKYRYALSLDPSNSYAHSNLGHALFFHGRARAGLAELWEAVRINPNNARAHTMLGSALYQTGDKDQARQQWRIALGKGDRDATDYIQKFGGN